MQKIPCRCYTDEFKHQAVALAQSVGKAEAARRPDMPVKTLGNWIAAVSMPVTASSRRSPNEVLFPA